MNPLKGLQASTYGPYAGLFFDENAGLSQFLPIDYTKGNPFHYDWVTISEDSTTQNDPNKSRFKIHRDYHFTGEVDLLYTQSILTGQTEGVGPCTAKRYVDYFALQSIDRVIVKSDHVQQRDIIVPGITLMSQLYEDTGPEEKWVDRMNHFCIGGLSPSQRSALALATQDVRIPFDTFLFFCRGKTNTMPLSQLETDLITEIYWNTINSIIEYDGATVASMERTNIRLRMEVYTVMNNILIQYGNLTKGDGIIQYYRDYQTNTYYFDQDSIVPWQIDLNPFVGDVVHLTLFQRKTSEVETVATNKGFSNLLDWEWYQFRAGAQVFQGPIYYDETVFNYNLQMLDWPTAVNILIHYNESDPLDNMKNISGSKNYATYNTPLLEVQPSQTTIDYLDLSVNNSVRIDLICGVHNFIVFQNRTTSDNTIEFKKMLDF